MKMTRILLLRLTVACASVLHIWSINKDSSKATFELYSGELHGTDKILFNKIFHQCSLEDDCSFVVHDKKNSFKKYSRESNLPKDTERFIVFKKKLANFEMDSGNYSYVISSKADFQNDLYLPPYVEFNVRPSSFQSFFENTGAWNIKSFPSARTHRLQSGKRFKNWFEQPIQASAWSDFRMREPCHSNTFSRKTFYLNLEFSLDLMFTRVGMEYFTK